MNDDNNSIAEISNELMLEAEILLAEEQNHAALAVNYLDLLEAGNAATMEEFSQMIILRLDCFISAGLSVKVVDILNGYTRDRKDLREIFYTSQRNLEKKYSEALEIANAIDQIVPRPKNIWELKRASHDVFIKVLKLSHKEHGGIINKPATAHMALLRLYVINLLGKMSSGRSNNLIEFAKGGYCIGIALKSIEMCRNLSTESFLKTMHTVGARANRKEREDEKFSSIKLIAGQTWGYGCKLLHTQMLSLFVKLENLNTDDAKRLKSRLYGVAPVNLRFGEGSKKQIDGCVCKDSGGCPLVNRYDYKEYIKLDPSLKK